MRKMQATLAGLLVVMASGVSSAEGLAWVARDAQGTPVAGGSSDGRTFDVCRATVAAGTVVPGKFVPATGECRIAAGGAEQAFAEFELLVESADAQASYLWVTGHATGYPLRSVVGGQAADGQRLLVCAGLDATDGSVHPGYIQDENCVFGKDGGQFTSDDYLVLITNGASVQTTNSAQPSVGGFDPGRILGQAGVAAFCAIKDGTCAATPP
jgi:hypothetical protein